MDLNLNYKGRIGGIVKWVNELKKDVDMFVPQDKKNKINKKFEGIIKRVEGLNIYFKEDKEK